MSKKYSDKQKRIISIALATWYDSLFLQSPQNQ